MSIAPRYLARILGATAVLAILPAGAAASSTLEPEVVVSGPAKTVQVGTGYRFQTGLEAACPSQSAGACTVTTTVRALVHPATGKPSVVVIATGTAGLAAGTSSPVVARVTAAGARELATRGSLRAKVAVVIVDGTPAPGTRSAGLSRTQSFALPPVTLNAQTMVKRVALAPGRRLVLRLTGENASTGYAWKLDAQPASSPLRLVSTRSIVDPSCTPGTVGCFSIREYVFVGRRAGTAHVSVGLYGPTPETDATVRLDLGVRTKDVVPAPKVVTFAASGTRIALAKGQELVVQLEGNSSTGSSWRPKALATSAALRLLSNVNFSFCPQGLPGCGEETELTYANVGSGTTTVKAGYFHLSEQTPEKRFSVTVVTR